MVSSFFHKKKRKKALTIAADATMVVNQVASRRVIQTQAIVMLCLGMLGKFGALFVTIPEPVVGGVFLVMFGKRNRIIVCDERET